jgi:hypothetical protein
MRDLLGRPSSRVREPWLGVSYPIRRRPPAREPLVACPDRGLDYRAGLATQDHHGHFGTTAEVAQTFAALLPFDAR